MDTLARHAGLGRGLRVLHMEWRAPGDVASPIADGAGPPSLLAARTRVAADRVVFDGHRVAGVVDADGRLHRSANVVLSAELMLGPAILLRSGIGPAARLEEFGIPVVRNLPVGERLLVKPRYHIVYGLPHRGKDEGNVEAHAVYACPVPGTDIDLSLLPLNIGNAQDDPALRSIALVVSMSRPESVGYLRLRSRDPRVAPRVTYNLLATAGDRKRMLGGVRLARALARQGELSTMLGEERVPGVATSDEHLEAMILEQLASAASPSPRIPMELEDIADASGSVHGVEGLRVFDPLGA
ncbi:GMC oxidoreductase [Luteibacter sp. 3190]|uniref:GMC oxidoreductase n=1 Tax=Luteibacter sp. 3190 TaxID=2817736 RepID=UPI00285A6BA8|nr:GMC oxidoreductase [Luteibacter sp. 3190]MDR6936254.1 choline dehydrogenase [Luteibacter sp. 3190]